MSGDALREALFRAKTRVKLKCTDPNSGRFSIKKDADESKMSVVISKADGSEIRLYQ